MLRHLDHSVNSLGLINNLDFCLSCILELNFRVLDHLLDFMILILIFRNLLDLLNRLKNSSFVDWILSFEVYWNDFTCNGGLYDLVKGLDMDFTFSRSWNFLIDSSYFLSSFKDIYFSVEGLMRLFLIYCFFDLLNNVDVDCFLNHISDFIYSLKMILVIWTVSFFFHRDMSLFEDRLFVLDHDMMNF